MLLKHKNHNAKAYVFYMDIRAAGRTDEFVRRAIEKTASNTSGAGSPVSTKRTALVVKGADTLLGGKPVEIKADLVVLASAALPTTGRASWPRNSMWHRPYGFVAEAHPKLRPVGSTSAGIFLAGACQSPRDIPETVAQASAAAKR